LSLLARARLPISFIGFEKQIEHLTPKKFLSAMALDKKVEDGKFRLILLSDQHRSHPQAFLTDAFEKTNLMITLRYFLYAQ
jgi:3-dehydroquinate synthetase